MSQFDLTNEQKLLGVICHTIVSIEEWARMYQGNKRYELKYIADFERGETTMALEIVEGLERDVEKAGLGEKLRAEKLRYYQAEQKRRRGDG